MACGTVKNMHDYLDLKKIEADLLRIKIELEKALDSPANLNLIQRNGSVRGKRFHVLNTIRRMEMKNQWKVSFGNFLEKLDSIVAERLHCGRRIKSCNLHDKLWCYFQNKRKMQRYS